MSVIYAKLHSTPNGNILAMCDEELIGKVLKEGTVVINIRDYSDFYKGALIDENGLDEKYRSEIFSANIVGKRSVDLAISNRIIKREHVKTAGGIPYAHAYRVDR